MKISEVSRRTGLTLRTIRFYTEKGLIHPEVSYKNGRDSYDFSDEDIKLLTAISTLRSIGLTVESIKEMISSPGKIEEIMAEHRQTCRRTFVEQETIYNILRTASLSESSDILEMSRELKKSEKLNKLPPPDLGLNFPPLDGLTKEEKARLYTGFHRKQLARDSIMGRFDLAFEVLKKAGILVFSLLLTAYLMSHLIPVRVSDTVTALMTTVDGSETDLETVTLKGWAWEPLWGIPYFRGSLSFEHHKEMDVSIDNSYLLKYDAVQKNLSSENIKYTLIATSEDRDKKVSIEVETDNSFRLVTLDYTRCSDYPNRLSVYDGWEKRCWYLDRDCQTLDDLKANSHFTIRDASS